MKHIYLRNKFRLLLWKFILNFLAAMKGKEQEHNKDDFKDGSSHIDLIPMDLTMEILTRLPVESLLKFQYVSKTWFSIIRSKYFIDSSVYNIFQEPSSRLLISFKNGELVNNSSVKYLFFFTSSQEEEESSSLVANLHMKIISMDAYFHTRCASLNGFICLSYKGRFMICNPSTRQVITLPEIADTNWKSTYRYLGYDPVDDQYKAMCKRVLNKENDHEHMVLTLGSDKKTFMETHYRHYPGLLCFDKWNMHQWICVLCRFGFSRTNLFDDCVF